MAAITAGDVTAAIIDARALTPREPGAPNYSVVCELTIDPGTSDTYVTGGIPLTNQFDSTHAQFLGLDVRYPIRGICSEARISDALSPACGAYFYNGGTTAAAQTLVLRRDNNGQQSGDASATISAGTIAAVNSGNVLTDSGNGFVTAGFKVGDVVAISGFTGTAGNNQVGILTAVAAGSMSILTPVALVNDSAGETVTITAYRPLMRSEYGAVDVTLTGGIAEGDKDIKVTMILYGTQKV